MDIMLSPSHNERDVGEINVGLPENGQDYPEKGSGPSCIATERPSDKGAREARKIEDSKPERLTEKTDHNQDENCD
jgi:hypothetical protein